MPDPFMPDAFRPFSQEFKNKLNSQPGGYDAFASAVTRSSTLLAALALYDLATLGRGKISVGKPEAGDSTYNVPQDREIVVGEPKALRLAFAAALNEAMPHLLNE
jgi:hypothetical protein